MSCVDRDKLGDLETEEVKIVEIALDETIGPDYDSTKQYVFLSDTLGQVPQVDREFILKISQADNFPENFKGIDISFRNLVLGLIDIKSERHINVESLRNKFDYKIKTSSNWTRDMWDITIGAVTISRVSFSEDNLKACVYTRYICEGDCGGGQILFLTKMLDRWEVVSTRLLWVS
jgi:hypothetical protein